MPSVDPPVEGNRKAVYLVLNPLDQVETLTARIQVDVLVLVTEEQVRRLVLIVLDHPHYRDIEAQFIFEDILNGIHLDIAPIHEDHVGHWFPLL